MTVVDQKTDRERAFAPFRFSRFRAVARSRDGAAAIEFALLAIPYFLVIFAILETFIAFAAEELVSNAVDTMSRRMRTGQITYNLGRTTDMSQTQFRQAFCNEISILISCSTSEAATPSKLYLDVQTFSSFSAIPTTIPKVSSDRYAILPPKGPIAASGPSEAEAHEYNAASGLANSRWGRGQQSPQGIDSPCRCR